MSIVNQIIASGQILGNFIQHLTKNPEDFVELAKIKPDLAQRYAEAFSAGHVLNMLSISQEKGVQLITQLVNIPHNDLLNEKIRPYASQQFNLPTQKNEIVELLKIIAPKLEVKCLYEGSDEGYCEELYQHRLCYNQKVLPNLLWYSKIIRNNTKLEFHQLQFNLTHASFKARNSELEVEYDTRKLINVHLNAQAEEQWNQQEKARHREDNQRLTGVIAGVINTLLVRLDHTHVFVDKDHQRHGILDAEFKRVVPPVSRFSFLWRSRTQVKASPTVIEMLLKTNSFELIGKIITLLSPPLAMRQLQLTVQENTQLLKLILDNSAKEPKMMLDLVKQMESMPKRFFEEMIQGFHFDVLEYMQEKTPEVAALFYQISPLFMQRQFPHSVRPYTVQQWEDKDKEFREGGLFSL
jgi:hypothetical protein